MGEGCRRWEVGRGGLANPVDFELCWIDIRESHWDLNNPEVCLQGRARRSKVVNSVAAGEIWVML